MTGTIKRYLVTSAQSNTKVVEPVWNGILALKAHYDAELLVGTWTYNKAGIGNKNQKRKTSKETDTNAEWWDTRVEPYVADERRTLAKGLEWCGEMQILPTAVKPLSGMEGYSGRRSCIFPHAKFAMSSVPSGNRELTKIMYTSGTVTGPNYIQKKAGLKANFHHGLGCLIVEVDGKDNWWVRQVNVEEDGTLYDLDTCVRDGQVSRDTTWRAEGIVWGDIHVAEMDPHNAKACWGEGGILDTLSPRHQIFHDLLDARSIRKHDRIRKNHLNMFQAYRGGHTSLEAEIEGVRDFLTSTYREGCTSIVVNSNHDQMLQHWIDNTTHHDDPENAVMYLRMALHAYECDGDPSLLQWAVHTSGLILSYEQVIFLQEDESFILCPDANGGIECGMHGHRGPNGARGSITNIARMGRKSVIGHSHTAGIFEGCHQVGTSSKLRLKYTSGPSSWTHTHGLIYPNGKRTLLTVHNGKWRA